MSLKVTKSNLKPKLLSYLRDVQSRKQSIIILDRDKPVAKIIPFNAKSISPLAQLKGSVLNYIDPLEPVGIEDWDLLK